MCFLSGVPKRRSATSMVMVSVWQVILLYFRWKRWIAKLTLLKSNCEVIFSVCIIYVSQERLVMKRSVEEIKKVRVRSIISGKSWLYLSSSLPKTSKRTFKRLPFSSVSFNVIEVQRFLLLILNLGMSRLQDIARMIPFALLNLFSRASSECSALIHQ